MIIENLMFQLPIEIQDKILLYTDLDTAIKCKNEYVINKLYDRNSFSYAIENGHLETVKWIYNNLAGGREIINMNERFAIDWAAYNNQLEIVEWLYFNCEYTEMDLLEAIQWAETYEHFEITEWLQSKL